jgi:protein SCO1/2
LGSIAALLLGASASAQVLGGPQPPAVDWNTRLGESVPLDAEFTDSAGNMLTFGEALGDRTTILVMLYYECPMLCDLVLDGLVRSLKALNFKAGESFNLVALTIDPDETLAVADKKRNGYLERYDRDVGPEGWRFLLGAEDQIRAVADAVGFEYAYVPSTGEYAHAAGITLLTPGGVVSRYLFGIEFPPRDLRFGLIEASEGRIGSLVDKFILRCFYYDPANGRYGFAIMNTIRFTGATTILLLVAFIWRSLRRDSKARSPKRAHQTLSPEAT